MRMFLLEEVTEDHIDYDDAVSAEEMVDLLRAQLVQPENAAAYREAAKDVYAEHSFMEFDDNAVVSVSETEQGAYVQAWVWVDSSDL